MRTRGWLALILLAPLALISLGTQVAAMTGVAGVAQTALAVRARDSAGLERGMGTLQSAARILDRTWSSPAARVLEYNPMTMGAMDDLRTSVHALAVSTEALEPLAEIGAAAVGFDGDPPIATGTTIDPLKAEALAGPVAAVHDALIATGTALADVDGSGPLGRPIGAVVDSVAGSVDDLTQLSGAATIAMPDVAEALGSQEPRRYLVAALNDAEVFGSGGAPLSAFVVQADKGSLSVPISGQLESKLSPNNPPIDWEHAGGPPWYREGKRYPFVNSNFHPDFTTASVDMRRAWAALGYPEVNGVLTVDMSALATILAWTGPIDSPGFGEISSDTLVTSVLVDAYRQFNSPEGVIERHARNEELTTDLIEHLTQPLNLMSAIRGTMDAIPPRHLQASFDAPALQEAVDSLAAGGELAQAAGDLIAVHSQSAPNKLSVFQDRRITQDVQLTAQGGAKVRRSISFTNAVPEGLEGDPTSYAGYLALRARMRVAYRLPLAAVDPRITTGNSVSLVPVARTGPFPDDHGGQVLWQGHETDPGDTTTVVMEYSLPAGTFAPGTYDVHADPQALAHPAELGITVRPAPGTTLPTTPGWTESDGGLTWSGSLDRPLHLTVG
jgi:Protein of unknown function (DUF4012)